MEILTHHVIKETALQQHSSLSVGTVSLPVPPANVDPSDYSKLFNEKTSTDGADVSAVRALGLSGCHVTGLLRSSNNSNK